MTSRIVMAAVALAMVLAAAGAGLAQTADLTPLKGQTSFGPAEEGAILSAIEKDLDRLVAGRENDEVNGARARLVALAQDPQATPEFRATAAKVIIGELDKRLPRALVAKNRLSMAIVAARMQNPESVRLLVKLIGDKEVYPSVRYWAAKGLAGAEVVKAIKQGTQGLKSTEVVAALGQALAKEQDAICVGVLFSAVQAIGTEQAADVLIDSVEKKAAVLDLGNRDAVETMRAAVEALATDFDNETRPPAAGKQRIVAAMAQVLVRVPPSGDGLDLLTLIDEKLTHMTGEKTGLADAVKEVLAQSPMRDPKLIDLVWVEQLNWVETLLKAGNKDLRLKARPTILEWSPARSAEVVAKSGTSD